jgi:hypothetical protein
VACTFDVDEAREMLQFNDAFRRVVDRLDALTAGVSHTIESRKAKVVFAALRTYEIAKGLARDPDSAALVGHLENLRHDLGCTNGGASSSVPLPAPAAGLRPERGNDGTCEQAAERSQPMTHDQPHTCRYRRYLQVEMHLPFSTDLYGQTFKRARRPPS